MQLVCYSLTMWQDSLDYALQIEITEGNLHYIGRRLYLDLRVSSEAFTPYLSVLSVQKMSPYSYFTMITL